MNETTTANTTKSNRFALTRRNQKGQVAIFVALIFQVVFVFFALLINVGLLVHQKINLQQSVDLAAYYGAGKQAEVLNAIAHVNFQIKQTWKLMTWRYRILGTFGFQKDGSNPINQTFPFENNGTAFSFNGRAADPSKCTMNDGSKLGTQDIPFFCIGHAGFTDWFASTETTCRLSCDGFKVAYKIPTIPSAGNVINNIVNNVVGDVAGATNNVIEKINDNTGQLCKALGPISARTLARFIAAYSTETLLRTRTIEMLAKNLSKEADKELDLDGDPIFKGVKTTLLNNLTEANKTGFLDAKLAVDNGLSKCAFNRGQKNEGREFLKRIEFDYISYFLHNCKVTGDKIGNREYLPEPVYDKNGLNPLLDSTGVKPVIEALLVRGQKHTVGYEKNPNCVEYYAVKASSNPTIPFLPLAKIQLNAVAVAKPFGGTIGPAFGKKWGVNVNHSEYTDSITTTKVDQTLPFRDSASDTPTDPTLSVLFQPNFSLYVGDKIGLRDSDYIAAYHSALAMRDIKQYGSKSGIIGNQNGNSALGMLTNTGTWPMYENWQSIGDSSMSDFRNYDSLAKDNTGTRALELSVVAPNQFDITYYSIEPDFFNTYYKRMYNSFAKYKAFLGGEVALDNANQIRPDYGAIAPDASLGSSLPLVNEKTFSVRDQILAKNQIFQGSPIVTPTSGPKTYTKMLNYLVSLQSSLLTGWTFLNYSTYSIFPGGDDINQFNKTMTFGRCADPWNTTTTNDSDKIQANKFQVAMNVDPNLPAQPGNCVTGGRVGYSVKLVSPSMVRDPANLDNQLPDSFFSF